MSRNWDKNPSVNPAPTTTDRDRAIEAILAKLTPGQDNVTQQTIRVLVQAGVEAALDSNYVRSLIAAAVSAEREACAQTVEDVLVGVPAKHRAAAAIRARGLTP